MTTDVQISHFRKNILILLYTPISELSYSYNDGTQLINIMYLSSIFEPYITCYDKKGF